MRRQSIITITTSDAAGVDPCATDAPGAVSALTAVLLLAVAAMVLIDGGAHPDALQKMAGYTTTSSAFKDAKEYLDSLRDGLIPLAIPMGAIGLTAGGVAYMVGNIMAQKILGGVVIGLALTLMAPSLVA